jgi:hypothetical protein
VKLTPEELQEVSQQVADRLNLSPLIDQAFPPEKVAEIWGIQPSTSTRWSVAGN